MSIPWMPGHVHWLFPLSGLCVVVVDDVVVVLYVQRRKLEI